MASKVTGDSSQGSVGETLDSVARIATDAACVPTPAEASPAHDYPSFVEVERHHYVVSGEIAKGGMGRVLDARDRRLGRPVAIKELLPKNRAAARRFEREARITARLQHPSIIHVHEAGVWSGGEPFYAMQKVSGRSLDKVVAERATLEERLGLLPNVIAVVDALAYAHNQNVIHRDLKPSNVLVGEFGETVVIDWGLAKDLGAPPDPALSLPMAPISSEETLSGAVVGTPAYMPPEQARGESVDQRADVYALGALLFHVLVGRAPYTGASSKLVLAAVLDGPPVPVAACEPGAPADLTTIVDKAMARDPIDRYASAGELAADLKRFQTGQLVAAHHYSRAQLLWRWLRKNRLAVAISLIAVGALATVGLVSLRKIIDAKDEAVVAKDEAIAAKELELARRRSLLEERGRAELLAGRAGPALVNLLAAARGQPDGALGFLIADAARPFQAEAQELSVGNSDSAVHVAFDPDGRSAAIASENGLFGVWGGDKARAATSGAHRALAWSSSGDQLALAERSGRIRILRFVAGQTDVVIPAQGGAITDLSFSPDGRRLCATSDDGVARIWFVYTDGSPIVIVDKEHRVAFTAVQFAPDGEHVVTATEDGSVAVWNGGKTSDPKRFRAHRQEVRSARWSPDGRLILTASTDGTAQIWDVEQGKQFVPPLVHDGAAIEAAIWSHDGTRVLTAGADRTARIWQMPEQPEAGSARSPAKLVAILPHTDTVLALAFSRDDRWIATAGRVARVWDAAGQPVAAFEHDDPVVSLDFDEHATRLLTGTAGGRARWWSLAGLGGQRVELESPIYALAVSSTGSVAAGTDDSRVTVWSRDGRQQVLRDHLGRVFAVAFSPDGSHLVSAGEDPVARLWTLGDTPRSRELSSGGVPIRAAGFSPDGRSLVLGDDAGALWLWDGDGQASRHVRLPPSAEPSAITAVAFAADGRWLVAATSSGGVYTVARTGEIMATYRVGYAVTALAIDQRRVVVAGEGDVEIWSAVGGQLSRELALEGPTGVVRAVALTRDGSRVITAGDDGVARVWDAGKGKLLGTREPHGGQIGALALTPDDASLWTGSSDGTARAWDVHAARDTRELEVLAREKVPWALGAEDDIVRRIETRRK